MTWNLAQAPVNVQSPTGLVTTLSATFGSAVTAGNLIVVAISNYGGSTVTVQDIVNTTNYTQQVLSAVQSATYSGIWTYLVPANGGGSGFKVTMTSLQTCYPGITIFEFSFTTGYALTYETPTGTGVGTSNSPATGALTITGNDLIFMASALSGVETPTAGAGFTLGPTGAYVSGKCEGIATQYLLNETLGVTPVMSLGGSTPWSACSVAIKAAAPVPVIALVPYVTKNGLFVIGVTNPAGTACENITSLGTAPVLYVNGSLATLYGPVWYDVDKAAPFVAFQVTTPSSIASTDTLTYTIPAHGIVTALGGNLAVATQAAVTNYVGQLEPGFGGCTSFVPNRTMQVGVNLDGSAWANYGPQRHAKNLRYIMYFAAGGGTTVVYNSSDPTLPETWTSSGGMNSTLANYQNSNGIEVLFNLSGTASVTGGGPTITFSQSQTLAASQVLTFGGDSSGGGYRVTNPGTGTVFTISPVYGGTTNGTASAILQGQVGYPVPQGQWAFQFKDVNATNSNALKLWLVGNPRTCVGSDTAASGFGAAAGSTGVRSVGTDNQTVTITYQLSYPNSTLNATYGYNMGLKVYVGSPLGLWHTPTPTIDGPTISDFWAFAPGDSTGIAGSGFTADTSNPLAMANTLRAGLTASNGNGPSIIRALNTTATNGYGNYQNFSDCQNINAFGWGGGIPNPPIALSAVRNYNTNPNFDNVTGNSTYGWAASILVYDPRLGFDGTNALGGAPAGVGLDGKYLDLSARGVIGSTGGTVDYGAYMNPFPGTDGYAALEFVTTAPHNLRSGDLVIFPGGTVTQPFVFPITGASQVLLAGTVSVTHGNQSITFSQSQTFTSAVNGLIFGSDTTGNAYYIPIASPPQTGTTFTIWPQFQGTTDTTSSCTTTPIVDISNLNSEIVHVTGASTFAIACGSTYGITSGTTIQQIASTNQIALSTQITPQLPGGVAPYGFYANVASQWPGTKLLVPLMPYMTDACLQSIADEIAVNSLANATILFEMGDEHWNIPGFPTGLATTAFGRLMAFAPPLQAVNSYYTVPLSPTVLNSDAAYTLLLAHQHDVIQAQFDTHNKGLHAGRMFGAFWVDDVYAANMVNFASGALGNPSTGGLQQNIPMEYVAVAPYPAGPTDNVTWQQACATGGTNPGSWPVPIMLDLFRHYCKYTSGLWGLYSGNWQACQTYAGPTGYPGQTAGKPTLIGYECQLQNVDPHNVFGLEHDCFYHPAMADAWTACFGSMQDGSPLYPGSGLAFTCILQYGAEWGNASSLGDLWSIQIYGAQLSGDGSGNLFTTAQGGSPADGLCHDVSNVTVEGEQMKQWFAAANGSSTPTSRRWFPGLTRII